MASKKLTILFVAEVSHIGGASTAIEEIANAMSQLGHHVVLIQGLDRDGTNWSKKNINKAIKIHNYPVNFRTNIGVFSSLGIEVWKMLGLVGKKYNFDVIYTNYAYSAGLVCLHPLFANKKKIFLFHGDEVKIMWSMIPKPQKHKYLGLIKRLIFSGPFIAVIYVMQKIGLHRSNRVVSFSTYTRDYLQKKLGIAESKIDNSSLGVETKLFKPPSVSKSKAKELVGLARDTKMIICTSRFEFRKGIDLLVSAFPDILSTTPNTYLYLATSADEYYLESRYFLSILKQIRKHNISRNVHLLLNLSRKELVKYYQAADLSVFPSRELETFGLVMLEAMACGTPVVTYKFAGAPQEIVSKVSSELLFNSYTKVNLEKVVTKALDHSQWLQSVAKKSVAVAQKYTWSQTAQQLLLLYDK